MTMRALIVLALLSAALTGCVFGGLNYHFPNKPPGGASEQSCDPAQPKRWPPPDCPRPAERPRQ